MNQVMAASGATPRKFAEKIAMHNQKGAEEEAEFRKIMSECAAVKGTVTVPQPSMTPQQQQRPPLTNHAVNQMAFAQGGAGGNQPGRIHLSPNFPSAVPRHGSLPNVNADANVQMTMPNSEVPTVLRSGGSQDPSSQMFMEPGNHMISNQQNNPNMMSGGSGHHHSLRDSMVGSSGGSATQIHTIRSSNSTGPIRNKHRKDTSPYGSERLSISNATVGSSSHLSPPDSSVAWRRVRSDPFLHSSVKSTQGSSTGISPTGSVSDTPTAVQGSNGAISPLHGASPTMHRRVSYNNGSQTQLHHAANNVQNVKNNYQLGIPIPETSSGGELKPGSLPNLTNLEIGQSPTSVGPGGNHILNHACNLSNNSSGGTSVIVKEEQESPYSSSSPNDYYSNSPTWSPGGMPSSPNSPLTTSVGPTNFTTTSGNFSPSLPINVGFNYHSRLPNRDRHQSMSAASGGSTSFVRLSDTEISKILSIPMSLVSESSQDHEQAKNVNVSSANLCDNTQRNLLHLSKGIAVEQQSPTQNLMYGNNQLAGTIRIKTEDSQHPGDLSSLSNYRNPQSIQPPASPVMHGSPIGRSSSPTDIIGSPHSPAGNGVVGSCPQYPDAMALAGPNYQHFMDLTKDVQKLSVLETPPRTEQGMYIPTSSGYSQQQPINEFVDFFNNQQQIEAKNNVNQFGNQVSSPNPQTPSSIPDIILTADDGSDQALQRMLGLSNDFDCFSTEDFKEGLGKLDDNMFRLLSDNGAMDQLADPATEEHLKKV